MRTSGHHIVDHVDLLFTVMAHGVDCDFGVHVASVEQRQPQLVGRCGGERVIVENRRLSEAPQPFVVPLGRVAARQVVGHQLQFHEAYHPVVGLLTQIVDEFGRIDALGASGESSTLMVT